MRRQFEAILIALLALWLTFTLTFVLLHLVPTSALQARISEGELSAAEAARLIREFGLDQPVAAQYMTLLANYLTGDFGRSLRTGQPVTLILGSRVGSTLELVGIVVVLSVGLTFSAAFLAARSSMVRRLVNALSAISLATPVYWTGLLVLLMIGDWLRLPQSSLMLPVTVLTFHLSAQLSRMLLHLLDDAQQLAHVVYGRSKGLTGLRLWAQYILRPSAASFIAIVSSQLVVLLGSTVTLETLFARPGIGTALVEAVIARDYPVAQGAILLLISLSFLIGLSSRALSHAIDPRLRMA
jgi:peptide/nickel transport system permease protein